jgi:DNA-directed RNA polymerase sigma subunit (sigma70/sigma32)
VFYSNSKHHNDLAFYVFVSKQIEEVLEQLNERERVRQIESSAPKKLRHPSVGRIFKRVQYSLIPMC